MTAFAEKFNKITNKLSGNSAVITSLLNIWESSPERFNDKTHSTSSSLRSTNISTMLSQLEVLEQKFNTAQVAAQIAAADWEKAQADFAAGAIDQLTLDGYEQVFEETDQIMRDAYQERLDMV